MNASPRKPLREAAVDLVRQLHEAGHVAYFVGGCVRDRLLGLEPSEYDIATDALPEQVRANFPGARLVGESFGVMLVRCHGHVIEVATFRSEAGSADHRHPDTVVFTDEHEDVQRRDFTVNGLFEDPINDRIVDHVGGREDLEARCLRAIGDPMARFDEDHLRMLRAVRFAARFDMEIEPLTADAIRTRAGSLSGVSPERIGVELRRMFTAGSLSRAVRLLDELQLDSSVLSEAEAAAESAWPRCDHLERMDPPPSAARFEPAVAAWLLDRSGCDVVNLEYCDAVGDRLVFSNQERARLGSIIAVHERLEGGWSNLTMAARKRLASSSVFAIALQLLHAEDASLALAIEEDVASLAATPAGLNPSPLVKGADLIEAGLDPGPGFGDLLDAVYDAQLEGRISSQLEGVQMARSIADSGGS